MRRWWLVCACLGLLLLTSHVFAIGEAIEDLEDVATIMPDDTAFYFVMRTDEQVLDDLNTLVSRVGDKLALFGFGSVDLEDELRRLLGEENVDYDLLRAGIGDFLAVSLTTSAAEHFMVSQGSTEFPAGTRMYLQVRDRAIIEDFLGIFSPVEKQGSYAIYNLDGNATIALSDEWFILMGDTRVPDIGGSLAKQSDYERLAAKMPGSDYGGLMYMTPDILGLTVEGVPNDLRELTAQHALFGFALDQQRHLILDVVQTTPDSNPVMDALPTTSIDPEFLRYVPEDTDLVVQFTDVASYVDYIDAYMESFAPGTNVRRELETAMRALDLNLQDDLLGWMDGEALLYSTFDLETLIESNGELNTIPFEFGFVIETSDARASQRFFDVLTSQLTESRMSEVRIGSATINNVKVTTIRLDIPNGAQSLSYEIMMGVTDKVAFIASSDVTQFITAGRGKSLLDNPDYTESAALYLPGTKQVIYASEDGVLALGAGVAALVFLGNDFQLPDTSIFEMFRMDSPYIAYQPGSSAFILELAREVLHSASITSSLEDGFQTTRLVFSLE